MADTLTGEAVSFVESHPRPAVLPLLRDPRRPRPARPAPEVPRDQRARDAGDVIQELDWSVGQVLGALDRLGLAGRPLVIFTSDNGGVMDDGYQDGSGDDASGHRCNGPLRGFKGGLYEGGTRVPFLARWPGHVPAGKASEALIAHVDLLATVATLVGAGPPRRRRAR